MLRIQKKSPIEILIFLRKYIFLLFNWNLSYSFEYSFSFPNKHSGSCEGLSQGDHAIRACLLPMPIYERLKEVGYRNASAWKKSFYLWPLTNASPAVTSVSPVNILKVVVLPAPFTPEVDVKNVSNIKRTFSLTTSFRFVTKWSSFILEFHVYKS